MHECAALGNLTAPFVEVPFTDPEKVTKLARHTVEMRQDYVGPYDPVMSVTTEHANGRLDGTVFPITAVGSFEAPPAMGGVGVRPHAASAEADASRYRFRSPQTERMARVAKRYGSEMAWTASGIFTWTMLQMMTAATAINLNTNAEKVALYTSNSMTPDKTVTGAGTSVLTYYNGTASQWVVANECGNSGTYAAGGTAVTPVSCLAATNVVTFTSSGSPQWTGATITAYGDLVYDTTASIGVCFNWFGGVQTVTAGTFTIVWSGSGICYVTM
jgi:hypothetical protein